jgi:antitoxin ParD1/3/4/toxin ParE1/3/4
MQALYEVVAEAQNDLLEIWQRIAEDSVDLANRIEREFEDLFACLGRMPEQGHTRTEVTRRRVLFFSMYSFVVVYQPDVRPIMILAVLRGSRNLKRILRERLRTQ